MKTDGCVETICAITLCHHGEPNPRIHAPQQGGQRSSKRRDAKARQSSDSASKRMVGARSLRGQRGFIVRGRTIYVKWSIPRPLQAIVGKTHFVRSLGTGRVDEAVRQARVVGVEFEQWLRQAEGHPPEPIVINPAPQALTQDKGKTFEDVFTLFINDPAKKRTPKTVGRYHEMVSVLFDIVGKDTAVKDIDRETCRKLLDTLRWLPANARKRFPTLSAKAAAKMAKAEGTPDLLGPVSVNGYMIVMSTIMTYALNEGLIDRNHTRGLRVNDPVKKRDKRQPYTIAHLNAIFRGKVHQDTSMANRMTAKWFVPLIALFTGMRLNEICSLEPQDIVEVDGVPCFTVSDGADKHLKTEASRRLIPIHQALLKMGLLRVANIRQREGSKKLFPELARSKNGHYSVEFSKWYGRYSRPLINERSNYRLFVFHSYRHCFRDALRDAKIDEQLALALGGWASASKHEVHQHYGRGYNAQHLKEAIDLISYHSLNLDHLMM